LSTFSRNEPSGDDSKLELPPATVPGRSPHKSYLTWASGVLTK
jgi:hypothetical protein